MNWIALTTEDQWQNILKNSLHTPQVIFKHSSRCSVSSVVKNRLEKNSAPAAIDFYFLNIIAYRELSNKIADDTGVHHESPQVLLIKNEQCVYEESHFGINMADIAAQSMAA